MISQHTTAWSFHVDKVHDWAAAHALFSADECESIIDWCKKFKTVKAIASDIKNIRKSRVVFINPEGLEWVYERMSDVIKDANSRYFNFDLWGFQEGLQFAEYKAPGGRYETHVDRAMGTACRKLSTVLLLSDEDQYKGGDLQLMPAGDKHPTPLTRKRGSLIMFPSFIPHRVTPVTKGVRHSLVGWVMGPQFK